MKQNAKIIFLILTAVILSVGAACKPASTAGENKSVSSSSEAPKTSSATSAKTLPAVPEVVWDTEIEALDGSKFKIADYKGKVLLLNVWAVRCGPCRVEMPELVKIYDEYKDKGVEIVGLNVENEPKEVVQNFTDKIGVNYKIAYSTDEMSMALEFDAIPYSYVITKDGKFIGIFRGYGKNTPERLRQVLEQALSRPA